MSNTHIFIILLRGCQGNKWKYRWKVDKILLKMEMIYRNSRSEPIFCKLRPDRRWTKNRRPACPVRYHPGVPPIANSSSIFKNQSALNTSAVYVPAASASSWVA